MMKFVSLFAIAVALTGAAASAETVTVTATAAESDSVALVSSAGLDLGSAEGVTSLRNRVRAAARLLCLEANVDPLEFRLQRERCFKTALSNGYGEIDHVLAERSVLADQAVGGARYHSK